ncbi:tetratricopeptide repeat protein [Larkinella soli]|uniref:tetratricopeptide repeat protein n=1 Tax=Larkinella soli TaxID=1770527 RepID=UPI0013E2D794|nr:tetratricopeptide repeat protein [Larkinella soli]
MKPHHLLLLFSLFIFGGCQPAQKATTTQADTDSLRLSHLICRTEPTDRAWYTSGRKAPLFDNLGGLHFPITTRSDEAQRYFDQGLMLSYGFNHAEAARSFYEATRIDSTCAMAYWGFAYVLGPNYNAGMEKDNYERAYTAIRKAIALSETCTPKEKAMIDALAKRYPARPVDDRRPFDMAYSAAMKAVNRQFPDDVDLAALYAESLMDLHPWDLWEKDGRPKPWTPEIVSILEELMQRNPRHTGPHHFYIHAVEASKTPERGLASADVLGKLAPNAGHLVHMPSHIYIRTGHYHEGSVANQRAVGVDSSYLTACYAQGSYPLMLVPHNYHFLSATATLEGNSRQALASARKVAETTKVKLMTQPEWTTLQHYYTIPYNVAIKFEKWDEILRMSASDTVKLKYPTAVRHYARGMAYAGKGRIEAARAELAQLEKGAADPEVRAMLIWGINSMGSILDIARRILKAEILQQEGQAPAGMTLLREAVAIEDQLNYNEPPDWFFSVRHHLGAHLLKAKQYAEAEKVYNEDLREFPRNIWALTGLYQAQTALGATEKARHTKSLLDAASKWADKGISELAL